MPLSRTDEEREFSRLLKEHQQILVAYLRSLLPGADWADVYDVLQQTNLVIWKKRASFQHGTNFKAWIFSIARYEFLAFRRTHARRSWLFFDDDVVAEIADEYRPDQKGTTETMKALAFCLEGVRPHDRALLHHRYTLQMPLEDYAGKLGRSVGTLKARLFQIRGALRKCIDRRLREIR